MLPFLAATTALALISQLAAPVPYKPSVRVQLGSPQFVLVNPQDAARRALTHHQPQRLCTTPLIRPQGNPDPKIVVEPPKNGAKIRSIDAPTCIER